MRHQEFWIFKDVLLHCLIHCYFVHNLCTLAYSKKLKWHILSKQLIGGHSLLFSYLTLLFVTQWKFLTKSTAIKGLLLQRISAQIFTEGVWWGTHINRFYWVGKEPIKYASTPKRPQLLKLPSQFFKSRGRPPPRYLLGVPLYVA